MKKREAVNVALVKAAVEELLTVPEFSQHLKIRESTTREWLLLGRIRKVKIGNSPLVRIPVSELTRLCTEIPARQ